MDKYRKTLKARRALLTTLAAFSILVIIYGVFFAGTALKENYLFEIITGACVATALISSINNIRISKALKDDKSLRQMYNRQCDERMKSIRAKAGIPTLLITSSVMILAGIVSGFFNMTVLITLFAAAFCQLLVSVIIKFVCTKII